MAEIKKAKPTDLRVLHKGTHRQRKYKPDDKGKLKLDSTKIFEWTYEVQQDRTNSKMIIQQVEIVNDERKKIGDAIVKSDIFTILNRYQCRDFIRNFKK